MFLAYLFVIVLLLRRTRIATGHRSMGHRGTLHVAGYQFFDVRLYKTWKNGCGTNFAKKFFLL
jgi:hypothetical protein